MKRFAVILSALAVVLVLFAPAVAADKPAATMICHDVFFSLKDNSAASRQKLVDACKKHLTNHPGTVFFSAGVVADDFTREVNDRDFDVALHIVFQDKAAHDKYQDAERHKQFIAENKDNWKKVRVFDSLVEKAGDK
jgi:hypothetical protein